MAPRISRASSKKRFFRSSSSRRREERRKIASEHISKLLNLAVTESSTRPDLANRYSEIAWSISTRFNVRLKEKRRFFCRNCKVFALPGMFRYRLAKRGKGINVTCSNCGRTYHRLF
jgi:RNase P subunit RPR2